MRKEIQSAEEASAEPKRYEECVLVFVSVEKDDDASVTGQAVGETIKVAKQLACESIVIYPYAHLSSDLATPLEAMAIVKDMEIRATLAGLEVHRVPFGWSKSFSIQVKGHPLAEQSKSFSRMAISPKELPTKQEPASAALKAEESLRSSWYVIDLDGNLTPVEEFDFSSHQNLGRLKNYEVTKVRAAQELPPHVSMMKRLGLVDYEPASDPGNLRYYPKGRMVKSLLERYVTQRVLEYGGVEVETPIMYDIRHPSLKSYLERFPARQYLVRSDDKEYFLRFSACFGQFLIAKDLQLSYRQLPLKLYELTRYSFRREKSGEVVGLRRLRAFTMPDCHAIVRNLDQAKEEFPKRFALSQSVLEDIGLKNEDYELAIRFTQDYYKENKEFIASLIRMHKRPALVEMWKERFFYFVLKWEFNYIDNNDKASALSTDQIDVENAQRFSISYVDESGQERIPIILHNSPSGAIERCIWALLENAAKEQRLRRAAMLPLWLSPTQVRLIPVASRFSELCEELSKIFEDNSIRVDIDDREESVGKRIRDAEREWLPYVVVIGEREERDLTKLSVRDRSSGETKDISLDSLIANIRSQVKGRPSSTLPLPKLISRRPVFEAIA